MGRANATDEIAGDDGNDDDQRNPSVAAQDT